MYTHLATPTILRVSPGPFPLLATLQLLMVAVALFYSSSLVPSRHMGGADIGSKIAGYQAASASSLTTTKKSANTRRLMGAG